MDKLIEGIVKGWREQIKEKEVGGLELVEELFAYLLRLGQEVLQTLYEAIEEQIDNSTCTQCQGATANRGRYEKTYRTRLGPVTVRRTERYCANCDTSAYALDEFLGVGAQETETVDFKEWICFHTQLSGSFQDTLDRLAHDYPYDLEPSQVGRILEKVHQWLEAADLPSKKPLQNAHRVYVGMDGILVRSCEPEQKFQEIKNAVIFSSVAEVSDGRKELLDKSYASTAGDVQAFQTRLEDACAARGVFSAEEVIVHGDGGEFIKTVTESGQLGWIARFGEKAKQRLIRILDPYHLLEKFKLRLPQIVAVKAQAQLLISDCFERIWQAEDTSGLADVMQAIKALQPVSEAAQEAQRLLLGYLERNRDWIVPYKKYRAAGYIVSSGFVESGNYTTVAKRMKHKKARWTKDGAQNIVDLRVLHLNDQWERFFSRLSAIRVRWNFSQLAWRRI